MRRALGSTFRHSLQIFGDAPERQREISGLVHDPRMPDEKIEALQAVPRPRGYIRARRMFVLRMEGKEMSWFKTPPKLLASDSCVEAMFDKAFTEVMGDLKPGRVFRTPLPVQPVRLNPARQEPPPAVVELAGQVLLKLIDQADSIVADPADLTKRAWDIANEFAKRYEENCR